jgi:DNA-binding MarR family transcriptional regulator
VARADGSTISVDEAMQVSAFRIALRSFLRSSERIARASGLTPQRHLLLLMIKGATDGSESSTVTELVDRLELAQSTVTELVKRAEDNGLVYREGSDRDGTVARLRLTESGERKLAQVFRAHEDERRRLFELLQRFDG